MHTSTQEVKDYVKSSLAAGYTVESLWLALLQQGWTVPELLKLFRDVGSPVKYPQAPKTHLSASKTLLGLGALIVIIAGVTLIGTNWSEWGTFAHIAAVFIPMGIMFGFGIPSWNKPSTQKNSIAFIFAGSMLFPLFVLTLCTELKLFPSDTNTLLFVVSIFSLALFTIEYFVFPSQIWTILVSASGLSTYGFFLAVVGITESIRLNLVPWFFFLPALLYLYLGMRIEKRGQKKTDAWYLYFVGFGTLIVTLFTLALSRGLVELFTGPGGFENEGTIVGWSVIGIGILFTLIAWLLEYLKQHRYALLGRYTDLFRFIGSATTLMATFGLGMDGHQSFYETLLLILSIIGIALSVWRKNQIYLFVGSIGLVLYIFSMGSEYFSDAVGWPITLFVAGILSMGVGYLLERLRKEYKQKPTPPPMVTERKAQ
jgi:hypothetical protein